jgi:hypothetical protein
MRKTIVDAGFALVLWNDVTERALRFLDAMVARSRTAETPRLGLHLVLGWDFPEMVRNFRRKSRGRTVWCRPSRIPARFVGDSVYERDELFEQA